MMKISGAAKIMTMTGLLEACFLHAFATATSNAIYCAAIHAHDVLNLIIFI
jgi:hypothetical protein